MTVWRIPAVLAVMVGAVAALSSNAQAAGVAEPWQLGFQEALSPVMVQLTEFHDWLLVLITVISIFVLALLLVCIFRFNAKANPTPSRTSHNTLLEVLWTAIPILILVVVAIPSFKLLYFQDRAVNADMTIKAIGNQWYWTYEYPDHGGFTFDAIMLNDDERKDGQPRLLATDTTVVVPVDTTVRVLVTATDVLHAWAIPVFGIKIDGVPGRLNETWFRATEEGTFYGQCSDLCGIGHGFMPIQLKVVSKDEFAAWVDKAKVEYGDATPAGDSDVRLADAKAAGN